MTTMQAVYDCGMYASFFFNGPRIMRQLMELDPNESFSPIQTKLFLRWCASQEIRKATGEVRKKSLTELAMVKSFRNQLKDNG
jgi:hypothetical protein